MSASGGEAESSTGKSDTVFRCVTWFGSLGMAMRYAYPVVVYLIVQELNSFRTIFEKSEYFTLVQTSNGRGTKDRNTYQEMCIQGAEDLPCSGM